MNPYLKESALPAHPLGDITNRSATSAVEDDTDDDRVEFQRDFSLIMYQVPMPRLEQSKILIPTRKNHPPTRIVARATASSTGTTPSWISTAAATTTTLLLNKRQRVHWPSIKRTRTGILPALYAQRSRHILAIKKDPMAVLFVPRSRFPQMHTGRHPSLQHRLMMEIIKPPRAQADLQAQAETQAFVSKGRACQVPRA